MSYYCAVLCLIVKHWTDLALMWNLVLMLPCGDFVTAVVILRMRGTTALLLTLVSPLLCLRATLGPHQLPITCFISLFLKFNWGKKLELKNILQLIANYFFLMFHVKWFWSYYLINIWSRLSNFTFIKPSKSLRTAHKLFDAQKKRQSADSLSI